MGSSGRNTRASTRNEGRLSLQTRGRRADGNAIIENPLAHLTDEELQRDVRSFVENHIPSIAYEDLIRAARVAKDIRLYDEVARKEGYHVESDLLVQLTEDEKRALRRERDVPFSERGMQIVIITVSIAALLQGMGIKAVSTPILAGETAVGFWRGSAILLWQLWVAFGIMIGFAFNVIFAQAKTGATTLALINAAPMVPSLILLIIAIFFCPESPRYHLTRGPNYDVKKAFISMTKLRNTELQALRDMYLVYKSLENESMSLGNLDANAFRSPGFFWVIRDFLRQYMQLFQQRRLYNALISASTVNLAQQLCGINVMAFYSGFLFTSVGSSGDYSKIISMSYSLGFGAINFLFALPAVRSIDTLGRRKWLLATLPFMALFMLGAGLAFTIETPRIRIGVAAFFLFMFSAAYSPGLGPIPFTLASESFPLSHREAGTSWAIAINFAFAGVLSIGFPVIDSSIKAAGALCLFAVLNVVAFVLVFLLVEETKRRTLEELDHIFAVSKRKFMRYQLCDNLPWLIRHRIFGSKQPKPELYEDMIWGSADCEDLSPFRAADAIERYHEPAVPETVELAQNRGFEFPPIEARAKSSEYDLKATNNAGPVSTRF
ncbi:polyol transporter 5 [Trichoderma asperellum]|uniref:Polyol transporter 5 n=1 Tax=Trichoderma asperellum TaxID=101201 RepID=A0A6V8QR26_TRIAP|nr:polyol transporter 5 [Trichoderma asperellum]